MTRPRTGKPCWERPTGQSYPPMSYNVWVRSVDNPLLMPAAGWHREVAHALHLHRPLRKADLPDERDRRGVLPADHLHRLSHLLLGAGSRSDLGQGGKPPDR